VEFIDKYRDGVGGVEPICAVLGAAPSTYHAVKSRPPSARQLRDEWLKGEILRVYNTKFQVYGARKVWRQLHREGIAVARCTVERLMKALGIEGVVRGKRRRTTIPDPANPVPPDMLQRDFTAPSAEHPVGGRPHRGGHLGRHGVRCVRHRLLRQVHRRWRLADHMRTDLPLDALEMALHQRHIHKGQTIHHSDHGSQYLSIRYTTTLSDAGVNCSAGTVGDSYDNALAESVVGLYKAELVRRHGPWRDLHHLELATLEWVDWFNNRWIHGWCGNIPPAEYEAIYYDQHQPPGSDTRKQDP